MKLDIFSKWFPSIERKEDAKGLAKQGAIGVLIFSAMNILGMVFVVYLNQSPVDMGALDAQRVQDQINGSAILLPFLLFFAYRVYVGKGWIVGGLVLAWFVLEITLKIMGGTANIGWIIFYVFVVGMLVYGIRACWWLRRAPKYEEVKAQNDA